MTHISEHEERIAELIEENSAPDDGIEETLDCIEGVIGDFKETLEEIATRPNGRSVLERVGTYLRCWTEELSHG